MPLSITTAKEDRDLINSLIIEKLPNLNPKVKNSLISTLAISNQLAYSDAKLLVEDVSKQFFPQTARDEFLDYRGELEGVQRLPESKSSGFINVTGTLGTSIPLATEFASNTDVLYKSTSLATIQNYSYNILSSYIISNLLTISTDQEHNFSNGLQVTISGFDQSAYNGTFDIEVTSPLQFTIQVSANQGTPTGTATAQSDFAIVPVESIEKGIDTNLSNNETLELSSAISGADNECFPTYQGLSGGADQEKDDPYRARISAAVGVRATFDKKQIEQVVRSVNPSIDKVLVKSVDDVNDEQARVYFSVKGGGSPIPSPTLVQEVQDAIDEITPITVAAGSVIVLALEPVATNFIFSSIAPNTSTMLQAIKSQLSAWVSDSVIPEDPIEEDTYRGIIARTIDLETGVALSSFNLVTPSGTIQVDEGQIFTIGSVVLN